MSYELPVYKIPSGSRTPSEIKAKIDAIDVIIDYLYETAVLSVQSGNIIEYEIHTGQTKQRVEHTQPQHVAATIDSYENIRGRLVAKLQPRQVVLKDKRSFRN